MLRLEKIEKSYQSGPKKLQVLRQFDLELAPSEMLAVMGRSGSGKTTLLNLIAGLDQPDSGKIFLQNKELTSTKSDNWDIVRQKTIGFVFQFNQLLPEFTALENVMLPGLLSEGSERTLKDKACDLLTRMAVDSRMHHLPSQLSGGEQQRVAIARALINSPKLLLADEPTGSLDLESGQKVFNLLLALQKEQEISCIVVTHNPAIAELCDRIHEINGVVRSKPSGTHGGGDNDV